MSACIYKYLAIAITPVTGVASSDSFVIDYCYCGCQPQPDYITFMNSILERAVLTLRTIGTAVWNGGFSTFVAFVLLYNSESYIFRSFFKVRRGQLISLFKITNVLTFFLQVFFLIVVFGLFHGLCFLPVVLSLLGPAPYSHKGRDRINQVAPKMTSTRVADSGETCTVFENVSSSQQEHRDSTPDQNGERATNSGEFKTKENKVIDPGTCTLPPKCSSFRSYDDAVFTEEL